VEGFASRITCPTTALKASTLASHKERLAWFKHYVKVCGYESPATLGRPFAHAFARRALVLILPVNPALTGQ